VCGRERAIGLHAVFGDASVIPPDKMLQCQMRGESYPMRVWDDKVIKIGNSLGIHGKNLHNCE
jgi:hypothetical protein